MHLGQLNGLTRQCPLEQLIYLVLAQIGKYIKRDLAQ
jgi:hypothetical protein